MTKNDGVEQRAVPSTQAVPSVPTHTSAQEPGRVRAQRDIEWFLQLFTPSEKTEANSSAAAHSALPAAQPSTTGGAPSTGHETLANPTKFLLVSVERMPSCSITTDVLFELFDRFKAFKGVLKFATSTGKTLTR